MEYTIRTIRIAKKRVSQTPNTPIKTKGEEIMLDDFIRRMIQAAIESLPIDGVKKADMLQSIMGQKKKED